MKSGVFAMSCNSPPTHTAAAARCSMSLASANRAMPMVAAAWLVRLMVSRMPSDVRSASHSVAASRRS